MCIRDRLESDGGWCFILICGANFSPVFLPILPGNPGEGEMV